MSRHFVKIEWKRVAGETFVDGRYSRAHAWNFDGGATVPASSSPHNVRVPMSKAENVDPEEAFVASIASCHMLWFLALAAKAGFAVASYADEAEGILAKNKAGRIAITKVTLRPAIVFDGGKQPSKQEIEALHNGAHELCYIAASVNCAIVVTSR